MSSAEIGLEELDQSEFEELKPDPLARISSTEPSNLLLLINSETNNANGTGSFQLTKMATIRKSRSIQTADEKVGILQKYSPAFMAGWQERNFVLEDRQFKWFKH